MKILFIGIGFYDYELKIKEEFDKLGQCTYFNKVKFNTLLNADFDLIFMIKGDQLSYQDLKKFFEPHKAKKILYLWDSIERIDGVEKKFSLFDKIYSFDRLDCLKNEKLIFKPLFYLKEFENLENISRRYDIFHLGWFHSDRGKILSEIGTTLNKRNIIKLHFRLTTGPLNYFKQLFSSLKYLPFLRPYNYSFDYYLKRVKESNAVLDISHPNQTGLTLRSIETLGANRKLITTNEDIINYPFYNDAQIMIISRVSEIHKDKIIKFLEKKSLELNATPKELKALRIDNWIKGFFDD